MAGHSNSLKPHRVFRWVWADATAKSAETDFSAVGETTSVGKWGKQTDTGDVYELTDDSPVTWALVIPGTIADRMLPAGGTTGQALVKLDGTDYNADWDDVGGTGGTGVVNVLDYGAVGDGTTNDYTAIAAAIATGKTVFFPPLVYAIGTGLAVATDYQTLHGYGARLKKTGNIDGITISANRCMVVGLTVNGNTHTGAGFTVTGDRNTIRDCFAIDNGDGFVIYGSGVIPGADLNKLEGCEAHDNQYAGFLLSNATDSYMNGCTSQSNGWEGLRMDRQSYSLTCVNCHFDDNNHSGSKHNVHIKQSDALLMSTCVITNGLSSARGIFFDAAPGTQAGLRVTNCAISQNSGVGIYVGASGGNYSNNVYLIGNRITDNTAGAVTIDSGCSGCKLLGNDFDGETVTDNGTGTVSDGNDSSNKGLLTVEEVDGSPSSYVKKIVFPNGTLGITANVATYTPSGGGGSGLVIEEVDGTPTDTATKLKFPNGTLSYSGTEATYTPAATSGGRPSWKKELVVPDFSGLTAFNIGDNQYFSQGDAMLVLGTSEAGMATRGWQKTLPTWADFDYVMCVEATRQWKDFHSIALGVRRDSTGASTFISITDNGTLPGFAIEVVKMSSTSAFISVPAGLVSHNDGAEIWLRIRKSGGTIYYQTSATGNHFDWVTIYSEASSAWTSASYDKIGIWTSTRNTTRPKFLVTSLSDEDFYDGVTAIGGAWTDTGFVTEVQPLTLGSSGGSIPTHTWTARKTGTYRIWVEGPQNSNISDLKVDLGAGSVGNLIDGYGAGAKGWGLTDTGVDIAVTNGATFNLNFNIITARGYYAIKRVYLV